MERLPKDILRPTVGGTTLAISKAFALWLVPAFASFLVWRSGWNPWLAWPLLALLQFVAAHGLHAVGLIGHDGAHFALLRNPKRSAFLGVLVSAFVPFHMDMGFSVYHADHHRFTNSDRDPDAMFFSQFKNFWSRLFLARLAVSRRYAAATFRLALNRWPVDEPIHIGLKMEDLVSLARFNVFISLTILAAQVALFIKFPTLITFVTVIPTLLVILISGLRPYVEHAETGTEKGNNSRSWISPVFDLLYGGVNYHLAHHLYPSVPAYRIRELHGWLLANGKINESSPLISTWKDWVGVASRELKAR
ncbi:MAG TPA: fatty acid desaturase [Bdellovibrionota bacterium]|jgi:fatty acid desaturase|nr:fatty acid desaturase [Bdellovibrionota bacterium]